MINIEEKSNGYLVVVTTESRREYVFKSTEFFVMLEFIGKQLYGKKIKVEEN